MNDLLELAKSLNEVKQADVTGHRAKNQEIQADVEIENHEWGLPSDVYEWIENSPMKIVDISYVSKEKIQLQLEKEII